MPSYSIVTFGCQMNQHDSDRIGEVLRAAGYDECAESTEADLVLLNTCSVREKAEHKLRSEVGRLGLLKAARPGLVIAVAGCVAQQEGERLARKMPQIDVVIGPDKIADLPRLLREVELGAPAQVSTGFDLAAPSFLAAEAAPGKSGVTAYVTVMKGCDERCSFCIVPTTRGPERYRPARAIIGEIGRLVAAGVREVTLLGQTVNSYRDPEALLGAGLDADAPAPRSLRESDSEFAELLRAIVARVPDLARLRYTSPHPRHLTPALIQAHRELSPLARHVHLPVQSGSDRVLKRMIRRYTVADYEARVAELRREVPGVTLSTDVIVGFPGETREDFEATLALVDRVQYSGLFGFKYSVRPFTPAQKLEDDVPEREKTARLAELFAVADASRARHLAARVGGVERVLFEGPGRGTEYTGRSERNEIVHVESPRGDPTGRILEVHIERAYKNSLFGALVGDGALPPPRERARGARRGLPVLAG